MRCRSSSCRTFLQTRLFRSILIYGLLVLRGVFRPWLVEDHLLYVERRALETQEQQIPEKNAVAEYAQGSHKLKVLCKVKVCLEGSHFDQKEPQMNEVDAVSKP